MPHMSDPPDGGWGWVIVISAFLVTFLSFGSFNSIGILFDVFIHEFGATKPEVSIIASIAYSLQCFLGPIVSLLQQRYNARKVVLCGSILIAIAFVLSAFASNIIYLYFSIGVLGGVGMSMVYLPTVVIISYYFHKKRSLATALACLGGHLGSFAHPYLIRMLISVFEWRGALFIIGAISLNSLPVSLLLRPINQKRTGTPSQNQEQADQTDQNNLKTIDSSHGLEAFISENIAGCQDTNYAETSDAQNVIIRENEEKPLGEFSSDARLILAEAGDVVEMPIASCEPGTLGISLAASRIDSRGSGSSIPKLVTLSRPPSYARQLSERIDVSWSGLAAPGAKQRQSSVPSLNKRLVSRDGIGGTTTLPVTPKSSRKNGKGGSQVLSGRPTSMGRLSLSSAISSSILSIPIYSPSLAPTALFTGHSCEVMNGVSTPLRQNSSKFLCEACEDAATKAHDVSGATEEAVKLSSPPTGINFSVKNDEEKGVTESPDLSSPSTPVEPPTMKRNGLLVTIKPFFRHFQSPGFTAFVASNFLLCLAYYTPSVFIAHWGHQLDISHEKTTMLLSLIGVGNIIGRPLLAFSADRWAQYRIPLFAMMVGLAGTITTITPLLATNFYFLAFFVFQFGFLAGTSQTLLTPILADMVPLSELSHAFGVLILADGIAMLIGPPLLALLPSYDLTFAISGLIMIASSITLIGPIYFQRWCPSSKKPNPECSCNKS